VAWDTVGKSRNGMDLENGLRLGTEGDGSSAVMLASSKGGQWTRSVSYSKGLLTPCF
jgi:hypothetical protein